MGIIILLPDPIFSQKNTPITISGCNQLIGQYSDEQATYSEVPRNYLREEFNLNVHFFGVPINTNLMLSTEQSHLKQEINTITFSINPGTLLNSKKRDSLTRFQKILMKNISILELGKCRPNYSPLTIRNISLQGVNIELTPGIFYLAYTGGVSKRAVNDTSQSNPVYKQNIRFVKFGIGRKKSTHFYFSFMHVFDDKNSVTYDINYITPQENYLGSTELNISLFKNKFKIGGEAALSMITRDVRSADIIIEDDAIPSWLTDFLDPKISSNMDYAYYVNSSLKLKNTNVSGEFRKIGPGFISLGVPFLRNDEMTYNFSISQSFLKRKVSLSLYLRRNRDNIIPWKPTTTLSSASGVNLMFRFRKLPYFQLNFSPNYQSNSYSDVNTYLFSTTSGYNYKIKKIDCISNVSFSGQKGVSDSAYSNFNSHCLSIYESLSFPNKLKFGGSFSINNSNYANTNLRIYTYNINISYADIKKFQNNIGVSFSNQQNKETKTGFYINLSFPAWIFGEMNINIWKNIFDSNVQDNYNELIIRFILTKRF